LNSRKRREAGKVFLQGGRKKATEKNRGMGKGSKTGEFLLHRGERKCCTLNFELSTRGNREKGKGDLGGAATGIGHEFGNLVREGKERGEG